MEGPPPSPMRPAPHPLFLYQHHTCVYIDSTPVQSYVTRSRDRCGISKGCSSSRNNCSIPYLRSPPRQERIPLSVVWLPQAHFVMFAVESICCCCVPTRHREHRSGRHAHGLCTGMGIGRIDQECRGTMRPVHWSAEGYMDMCAGVRRTTYLFADAKEMHTDLCTGPRLMSRAVHSLEIGVGSCAQFGD